MTISEIPVIGVTTPKKFELVSRNLDKFPTSMLNRVHQYFMAEAFSTTPLLAMGGVIALGAVLGGRVYKAQPMPCTSSLYVCVSARSGTGKNAPKDLITRILSDCDMLELLGGSRFTGESAIRNMLVKYPTKVMVIDEFGDKIDEGLNSNSSTIVAGGFSALKSLYSESMSTSMACEMAHNTKSTTENNASKPIKHPSLSILGLTTNEKLNKVINDELLEGGTLNRFIFLHDITRDSKINWSYVGSDTPSWLTNHLGQLSNKRCGSISGDRRKDAEWGEDSMTRNEFENAPLYTYLDIDEDMGKAFHYKIAEMNGNSIFNNLSQRWLENGNRLAIGLTVLDNPNAKRVPQEIQSWCYDFVEFHGKRFMDNYASRPTNKFAENQDYILKLMKSSKDNKISKKDLGNQKRIRGLNKHQRAELISALIDSEDIRSEVHGKAIVYILNNE